jgi:membrane-associated phospholipid phosphatase
MINGGRVGVAGAGVGFVVVTAGLVTQPIRNLDLAVRDLADAHRPPAADMAAQVLNRLGSGGVLTVVTLAIALLVAWRRRSAWPVVPVVAAFLLIGVVLLPLKLIFDRAAPHSNLPDDVKVQLLSHGLSYPSGHAVNTVVWYGVMCLLLPSMSVAIRWVPPVVVTLAGTYLGYHWLTDMLAGLCLGVLLDRALTRIPWSHTSPRSKRMSPRSKHMSPRSKHMSPRSKLISPRSATEAERAKSTP